MNRTWRILLVEDLPSDAYFVEREIKKVLQSCTFDLVETRADFIRSLNEFKPDIILSDFCIPGFDWLTAFRLARESFPLVPFIIVTGSTNPDIAAECMNAGVNGCVSKLEMKTLGPVILSVLTGQPPASIC